MWGPSKVFSVKVWCGQRLHHGSWERKECVCVCEMSAEWICVFRCVCVCVVADRDSCRPFVPKCYLSIKRSTGSKRLICNLNIEHVQKYKKQIFTYLGSKTSWLIYQLITSHLFHFKWLFHFFIVGIFQRNGSQLNFSCSRQGRPLSLWIIYSYG